MRLEPRVSSVQGDLNILVERIQIRDDSAECELCDRVRSGVTLLTKRKLGCHPKLRECVEGVLAKLVADIRSGCLTNGNQMLIHLRCLTNDSIAEQMRTQSLEPSEAQELSVVDAQQREIAVRALQRLPSEERMILERFYARGETPAEICTQMHLDPADFDILKYAARAQWIKNCRSGTRRVGRRTVRAVSRVLRAVVYGGSMQASMTRH